MPSSDYACLSPVKIPGILAKIGRCGRCQPCMNIKRLQWGNRLVLENYGINYRPLFVTCTYSNDVLPSNNVECIKYCQLWIKRLRRRLGGKKVRYFLVTENGEKNGRLHQHLIMWIPSIMQLDPINRWRVLHETWQGGRLDVQEVKSVKGLYYTTKYIVKNLTQQKSDGYVWSRYDGAWKKPGKLYTWSNKPRLGDPGLTRWEELTIAWAKNYPGQIPPNWFNMYLFGKMEKVYIPSTVYVKHVQQTLGISLSPLLQENGKVKKIQFTKDELETIIDEELKHGKKKNKV